jgi:hypothetical protein
MPEIAHIINPVKADKNSDLFLAQPITFETMRIARDFARGDPRVHFFSAQFMEDRPAVPQGFTPTADLERSVLDTAAFSKARKLPLIKDVLRRLYEATSADYLIYTNVDIALQPYFYRSVRSLIAAGYDAFVINRRTIPDRYRTVEEIPSMWAEAGEPHPGWDCFVFARPLFPRFELGDACLGAGWIGRVMITNMACLARQFQIFPDLHLTFHIGNKQVWKSADAAESLNHNKEECRKILMEFEKKIGPLDRTKIPGRFFRLF